MTIQPIWTETITVRTFETNPQGDWKIPHVFQAMTEIAAHHAAHLGFDYRSMMARDMTWVLSRLKIQFFHLPKTGDTVTFRTWPKGIQQKVFFMRDFQIEGTTGPYAIATSAWLLVNTQARRLLPPNSLPGTLPENEGRFAISEPLEKINPPSDLPEWFEITARYGAIDLMGHVTNSRYVEWVMDSFYMANPQKSRLDWLQVNYLTEVLPGEKVAMTAGPSQQDANHWLVLGLNRTTGARAFEAVLAWNPE